MIGQYVFSVHDEMFILRHSITKILIFTRSMKTDFSNASLFRSVFIVSYKFKSNIRDVKDALNVFVLQRNPVFIAITYQLACCLVLTSCSGLSSHYVCGICVFCEQRYLLCQYFIGGHFEIQDNRHNVGSNCAASSLSQMI